MVYALQRPLDERLPMKSLVLGVRSGTHNRTYPVSVFEQEPLINDCVGERELLLIAAFDNDYIQVFDRQIEPGITLTFKSSSRPGWFIDTGTNSEWSPRGQCMSGHYAGHQLHPFAHYNKIFWYVWADFFPGTDIYSQSLQADTSQSTAVFAKSAAGK
jgi:hypothetical protein